VVRPTSVWRFLRMVFVWAFGVIQAWDVDPTNRSQIAGI